MRAPSTLLRHPLLLACAAMLASIAPASPAHAQSTPSLNALIASIPSGTGYAALDLCSRAIAVGDDFTRVKTTYTAPMVQPLPSFWAINRSSDKVDVSVALLLSPRRAVFRPGLGCTLTGATIAKEAALRAQPFKAAQAPAADLSVPWPLGEGAAQTEALTAGQRAVIQAAATRMFLETTTDPTKKINTTALLVAQDGKLVHEQYASHADRGRQQLGWSMTKTLTALVAGLMERDARISLDAPVALSYWHGQADKASVTWRHLLNMAPGMEWVEGSYGIGVDDTSKMLFSQENQCEWTAAKPMVDAPGTVFKYSTGFANLAMCRLKELAGGTHQQIYDYYQQRLFAPLGIRNGYMEPDAAGNPLGGARGMLRPVDWLRLGQLVANDGQWNGQTVLNPSYVRFMAAPSPAFDGYGGMVWRRSSNHVPADLRAQLPEDLIVFAGLQVQYVVIVPSRGLVVLRQGVSFDRETAQRQTFQLVADLLAQR